MKRFISMLLAFALCISVLGGMSFAGAKEVAEDGTCIYTLNLGQIDTSDPTEWDSNLKDGALQSTIVPIIGYGDHGFKYWTADDATYEAISKDSKLTTLQLIAKGIRLYGSYNAVANLVNSKDGVRVSIAFEKPSTVPGFYSVKVGRVSVGDYATAAEIYASPLIEDNKDINHYMSTAARNGNTYSFANSVSFSELIYNSGTDDHVFSFYTGKDETKGYGLNVQLSSLTFTPVTATGINISLSSPYCFIGESAKASVTATTDSGSVGVVDSYVKYESSDKNVATISADGTITPVANGTTTITATVGEYSASQTFKVGTKTYSFIRPTLAASDWDSTLTSKNMQSTIVPLIGYGTHDYKYWDVDDEALDFVATNVRILQYYAGGLRVWSRGNQTGEVFQNPKGTKLALALKTPKSGFYEISHSSGSSDGQIADLRVYLSHISAEDEAAETRQQVEEFMRPENLVKQGASSNTGSHSYNRIVALNGTDNIIWTVSVDPDSAFSLSKIDFKEMEVSEIVLSSEKEEIEIDETTAVNAKANDKKIAHSFVTYESLNPTVAKVAGDGTVTALAAGEATIKATANGLSAETKITVAEPVVIPGEAVTDTTVSVGIVALEGGSVATNLSSAVSEVEIGTKVIAEATASDGYEFAYWKDSNGKVLSTNAKETFVINVNTSIKAYFEKLAAESDATAPVYFYNGNGEALGSETVEKGKTFADVTKPKNVSLTGFEFDKWSIADNAIINSLTRAVALFKDTNNTYTVKVGDEAVATGKKYGESVTVKATEADFTCWKLGEKVMSYNASFTFNVYGDITLTKVCEGAAEAIPTVVLDTIGGEYFLTYNVPAGYTKIEAGILFATSGTPDITSFYAKATEKTGSGQFTAKPNGSEAIARGYVIFRDASGNIRVIYA